MYKILLIDDEPRQLKALSNIIQKLRPDYEIVMAGDGQEGYDELQKDAFDVLITDIKMPNMDGLALLEKMGQLRERLKIVIISGFAEFSYAQQAICLGVNNYLVKPISKDDLEKMLITLEEAIAAEQIKAQEQVHLQRKLNQSLPVYLERQMNKWVRGTVDQREMEEIGNIFPFKGMGALLMLHIKGLDQRTDEIYVSEMVQDIKFRMKETLKDVGHSLSFFLEGNPCIMVTILNTNQIYNLRSYDKEMRLMAFIEDVKSQYDVNITIGISAKTDNIFENITTCYEQAKLTLDRRFYENTSKIMHYTLPKESIATNTWHSERFEKELAQAIGRLDKNLCIQLTTKTIKHECPVMEPQKFKDSMVHIGLNLVKVLRNSMLDDAYHAFREKVKEIILASDDYIELWRNVNGILYEVIEILDCQRGDINAVIIQKCKKFMDEHYDENLTLDMLALKYHFNNAYFSNLFKEYEGTSFSKYLTNIRLDHARKLLITTDYSMSAVAEQVGINDAAYFNRIFKREFGVAPNKYRQINT